MNCLERCTTGLFCPACWIECNPPDPFTRCRHCFIELEEEGLCERCRHKPLLYAVTASVFPDTEPARRLFQKAKDFPEVLTAYAVYQWIQLEWPFPDFVIPLFPSRAKSMARLFSEWTGAVYANPFKWWSRKIIDDLLTEDATLLVIDTGVLPHILKKLLSQLTTTSPKSCFLLSLFPYDPDDFVFDFYSGSSLRGVPDRPARTGLDRAEARKI